LPSLSDDPFASNIVSETASLTGQPYFIIIGLANKYLYLDWIVNTLMNLFFPEDAVLNPLRACQTLRKD
jgi:hypothetical protein